MMASLGASPVPAGLKPLRQKQQLKSRDQRRCTRLFGIEYMCTCGTARHDSANEGPLPVPGRPLLPEVLIDWELSTSMLCPLVGWLSPCCSEHTEILHATLLPSPPQRSNQPHRRVDVGLRKGLRKILCRSAGRVSGWNGGEDGVGGPCLGILRCRGWVAEAPRRLSGLPMPGTEQPRNLECTSTPTIPSADDPKAKKGELGAK